LIFICGVLTGIYTEHMSEIRRRDVGPRPTSPLRPWAPAASARAGLAPAA